MHRGFFSFAMATNVPFTETFFFLVLCFTNTHIPFSYFMFLNSNKIWKEIHTVIHFQNSFATLNVNFVGARSTDIAAVQIGKL